MVVYMPGFHLVGGKLPPQTPQLPPQKGREKEGPEKRKREKERERKRERERERETMWRLVVC